ncbi:MAG: aminotransferase class V-fold PLP-dependent enzyme [Alphaproteobacteria bacterium]|nr:aminotransferase class V-fold PLP-dependent enzyme [Alphaproteobacteria bacterium]
MLPDQRPLFDIPEDVVYINCAYLSPNLKAQREIGRWAIDRKVHPWTIEWRHFYEDVERARVLFARLINATADDIAVVAATSYGVATASQNLPLKSGQSIVALEGEHHSTLLEYRRRATEAGATLKLISKPKDGDWTRAVLAAIDEKTAWVGVPNCYWTDGGLVDLEKIGDRAREAGAVFMTDVTQSLGARPIDVRRLKPDYLMCSAYKWLLGPFGLGFLYVAPHRQDGRPLEQHNYSRKGTDSSANRRAYTDEFAPGARRYDMGERSHFIHLPMANVGMEQLLAWTPAEVESTIAPLTQRIAEHAAARQLAVPPAEYRVKHFIGLQFSGGEVPAGLGDRLNREKCFVSVRGSSLRMSPHVYNNLGEIDRFFDVFDRVVAGKH